MVKIFKKAEKELILRVLRLRYGRPDAHRHSPVFLSVPCIATHIGESSRKLYSLLQRHWNHTEKHIPMRKSKRVDVSKLERETATPIKLIE